MTPLRIGTRGSALALWQARTVANRLALDGVIAEPVVIRTAGDRLQNRPLSEAGGSRLFVKEIEEALIADRVDLAVHSAKDMPSDDPASLVVAAALPREDPRDALVLPCGAGATRFADVVARLGATPAIGTGSLRRLAQIRLLVPRARFLPARGNVDTRLRRLDAGEFDAIVLAAAGLKRLGNGARISALIDIEQCVPAPGQGIVAIQIRRDDARIAAAVAPLNDAPALAALVAERAFVAMIGGGCDLPLGAIAIPRGEDLEMRVIVAAPDGLRRLIRCGAGPLAEPAALGRRLADELIRAGAREILVALRS